MGQNIENHIIRTWREPSMECGEQQNLRWSQVEKFLKLSLKFETDSTICEKKFDPHYCLLNIQNLFIAQICGRKPIKFSFMTSLHADLPEAVSPCHWMFSHKKTAKQ